MMPDIPLTDWDLLHHWEWFCRSRWRASFRAAKKGQGGGSTRAFVDLCKLIDAEVALDASCGLGLKTICMHEMGLNILGADASVLAIEHARELATAENVTVSFFDSRWEDLPQNVPHHMDAIFLDALTYVPTWDALGAALVGVFHALKPGGFLMFLGAEEGTDAGEILGRMHEEWEQDPREELVWFHREGKTACAKIRQKTRGEDYIDDRYLFAVDDGETPRLESTVVRRPFYWTWQHWQELTRMAGFCHLETRTYEGYGIHGETIRLNVAWKAKADAPRDDDQRRAEPYMD